MSKKNKKNAVAIRNPKLDKELSAKSLATLSTMVDYVMPDLKKLKKLTRPALIKPSIIPVGAHLSGEILDVQDSISKRPDMKEAKLLLLRNKNNPNNHVDFLLPITGVIKAAVGGIEGAKKLIGQTLHLVRQLDGETDKYGDPKKDAPKKVYMFDVYIEEA